MDLTDEEATRLGRTAHAYRTKTLRISQLEAAKRGDLSIATIGRLERGETRSVTDQTLAGLETALDWQAGSVERVVAGGSPLPRDHPTPVVREVTGDGETKSRRVDVLDEPTHPAYAQRPGQTSGESRPDLWVAALVGMSESDPDLVDAFVDDLDSIVRRFRAAKSALPGEPET